jgi:outer membrane protein assembly factor BamB
MNYRTLLSVVALTATAVSGCGDESMGPDGADEVIAWRASGHPLLEQNFGVRGRVVLPAAEAVLFGEVGQVVARDPVTGIELWRRSASANGFTPVVAPGVVVLTDSIDATFTRTYARVIRVRSGAIAWNLTNGYGATFALTGDVLITYAPDRGRITGRSVLTGETLWSDSTLARPCSSGRGCEEGLRLLGSSSTAAVFLFGQIMAMPTVLMCSTASGSITTTAISPAALRALQLGAWYGIAADGSVVWSANETTLTAVSLATGAIVWQTNLLDRAATGVTAFVEDIGSTGPGNAALTAVVVGPSELVALRFSAAGGQLLTRQVLVRSPADAPMYLGRCLDDSFGYVTTDGLLRFANTETGVVSTKRSASLQRFVRNNTLPAENREGLRIGNGRLAFLADTAAGLFAQESAPVTVGVACSAP